MTKKCQIIISTLFTTLVTAFVLFILIQVFSRISISNRANSTFRKNTANKKFISIEKYNKLYIGMPYFEMLRAMGGAGIENSRTSIGNITTVSYTWSNPDGTGVYVITQNDQLTLKSQFGLNK
jgi:hypothetical protein